MKVCWLRHGEKENALGLDRGNPKLTPHGLKQAQKLVAKVKSSELPEPASLFCSETQRTHQTLEPLALEFGLTLLPQELLNQRAPRETSQSFHQRVQRGLRWIEDLAQNSVSSHGLYFCTHIDWLDEAYSSLSTAESLPFLGFWRPGEYLIFEIDQSFWKLTSQGVL